MSTVRLRKWLCRHAGLAVSLASFLWLLAATMATELHIYLINRGTVSDVPYLGDILMATVIIGIAGSAFAVGLMLGRSGLPVSRTLKGLKYAPVVMACLVAISFVLDVIAHGRSTDFGSLAEGLAAFGVFSLGLVVLQLLGWGCAALVVRHQVKRGRWEVTSPVDAAMARTSLTESAARHPVWSISLPTLAVASATAVALVIL